MKPCSETVHVLTSVSIDFSTILGSKMDDLFVALAPLLAPKSTPGAQLGPMGTILRLCLGRGSILAALPRPGVHFWRLWGPFRGSRRGSAAPFPTICSIFSTAIVGGSVPSSFFRQPFRVSTQARWRIFGVSQLYYENIKV